MTNNTEEKKEKEKKVNKREKVKSKEAVGNSGILTSCQPRRASQGEARKEGTKEGNK